MSTKDMGGICYPFLKSWYTTIYNDMVNYNIFFPLCIIFVVCFVFVFALAFKTDLI